MGEIEGRVTDALIKNDRLMLQCQFFLDGQIMETGKVGNYDYAYLPAVDVVGKTHAEIKAYIEDFISDRCKARVMVEYKKNLGNPDSVIELSKGEEVLNTVIDLVDLKKVIVAETEAEIQVDSEKTGFLDKTYIVTTDSLIRVDDITEPISVEK